MESGKWGENAAGICGSGESEEVKSSSVPLRLAYSCCCPTSQDLALDGVSDLTVSHAEEQVRVFPPVSMGFDFSFFFLNLLSG